jgi:hypothetical protein
MKLVTIILISKIMYLNVQVCINTNVYRLCAGHLQHKLKRSSLLNEAFILVGLH